MMKTKSALLSILTLALFSPVALPQGAERGRLYQDKLIDLADTLGRIHSIRILCNGQSDQYWRDYMRNFLDMEAPETSALRSRIVESFNAAYTSQQALMGECSAKALRSQSELSMRGQQLAESLTDMSAGKTP